METPEFIGMSAAAVRLGLKSPEAARELLRRRGVELVAASARFLLVRTADLETLITQLEAEANLRKRGRGRPSNVTRKAGEALPKSQENTLSTESAINPDSEVP